MWGAGQSNRVRQRQNEREIWVGVGVWIEIQKTLDNIPKKISGLGQTAHTLSKITV